MRRIAEAFCLQLDRIVSIEEATLIFGRAGQDIESFDFRCADPACRHSDVRIIGVNYREQRDARAHFVDHHFRRWDPHAPACRYHVAPDTPELCSTRSRPSFAHAARGVPLARWELPVFDPRPRRRRSAAAEAATPGAKLNETRTTLRHEPSIAQRRDEAARHTRSLEVLVDIYRHLQATRTLSEVAALELQVAGRGRIPLRQYLLPIACARTHTRGRVLYGGVRFVRDYGAGFRLRFIDRLESRPLFLYVTPTAAAAAGSARFAALLERLRRDPRAYCTAYALADPVENEAHRSFSLTIEELERLVLREPSRPAAVSRDAHTLPNAGGP